MNFEDMSQMSIWDKYTVCSEHHSSGAPVWTTKEARMNNDGVPAMDDEDDFYEEDEPVEKIEAIWNRPGKKGRTVKPRDTNQRAAAVVGEVIQRTESDVD